MCADITNLSLNAKIALNIITPSNALSFISLLNIIHSNHRTHLFHISIKSRIGVLVNTDLKIPYISRSLIYHGNNCFLLPIVKQILRQINNSLIIFNVSLFLLYIFYTLLKISVFQICTEQYYDPVLYILCEYRSMCFI